jgi:signal transduction histidine kinase
MLERVTAGDALARIIRILTESRPLDDILAEILSQTRAMLDAAETYILMSADDHLTIRASDGLVIGPRGRTQLAIDEGIEGLTARTSEAVVSSALRLDPRFVDPFDRPSPVGSMLTVPLVLRGRLLGVLVSTRRQPGRFASVEMWWLEVFGGLVASLIASDHAYRVQERRARQAETLLALSVSDDAAPVAPTVVPQVARAVGSEHCGILLYDSQAKSFDHTFVADSDGTQVGESDLTPEEVGPLAGLLDEARPLISADVAAEPLLSKVPFLRQVNCLIATPIRVAGVPRGVLYVGADTETWIEGDEAFLELVATRVGLMIERGELRERQREVERQQVQMAARQEFLGIVSHELKTPMAVMKAYTELLLRRAERASRTSEIDVLNRMNDQAERMLAMIEQLLDLRRMEAGLLTLEVSHFDLSEVVRRLAHEIELTTVSHVFTVETPGKVLIRADRRRIEEVITNLLDNAVKYSPRGGTIRVRVYHDLIRKGPESVIVSVQDEGPGVPTPDRERVFERFFQASGRLHKGRAGLGLGLYISRELVRRHGGDVWLESEPGHGATFFVRLPVAGPPTRE